MFDLFLIHHHHIPPHRPF